jgi:hypothetical protein
MEERNDEPGPAAVESSDIAPASGEEAGAADAAEAAAREIEAYIREKQSTGRRMAQRAQPIRDDNPARDDNPPKDPAG